MPKQARKKKQRGGPKAETAVASELMPPVDEPEHLADPRHIRRDARTIASLMSLGVVPEATAQRVLVRAFELAEKTESAREYAALLKVIHAAAKLGLEQEDPHRATMLHLHQHNNDTDANRRRVFAIAAATGT